jgi:hypothetical protein
MTASIDLVNEASAQKAGQVNKLFAAAWPSMVLGMRSATGLTLNLFGGKWMVGGDTPTEIDDVALLLDDASTCYVYIDGSGVVDFDTSPPSGWPGPVTGKTALWEVVTSGGAITGTPIDWRCMGGGTGGGGGGSSGIAINAQTGTSYTVQTSDSDKLITFSNAGAIAVTLPQATSSFAAPFAFEAKNIGVGAVTITPTTSTIEGATTLVLTTGQAAQIVSDGTNWRVGLRSTRVGVNAQTGTSYTYLSGDNDLLVTHTNSSAIAGTLPQATGAFGNGWQVWVQNRGAGRLTITPTTSTIDGAATLVLTQNQGALIRSDGTNYYTARNTVVPKVVQVMVTDQSTTITTGTAKMTWRMPFAMIVTETRAFLKTVSSSGNPAIDINEAGASIFSTTLTIDASEKTSVTAATPAVISDASLADDAEMTADIDTAGTGAVGLGLSLIGF